MITKYLNFLTEGYVFSDKNLSVNLDKFESGEVNKLLIFGPCGSGKSTIGRKLSKKYNVPLVEIDRLFWGKRYKFEDEAELPRKERDKQIEAVHKKLIKLLYDNKKLIIEGVNWLEIYLQYPNHRPTMLNQSMIILGMSSITAGLRAGKRNTKYKDDKNKWDESFNMIKVNYKYIEKPLKMIRNDVKDIAKEYEI